MSEHRPEHLDLCAGLALGSLDPADRRVLEEHVASGCEVCEAALADFSATTVMLAASVSGPRPSDRLRARVLEQVNRTTQESEASQTDEREAREAPRVIEFKPKPRGSAFPLWIPALAAAALAVTSVLFWNNARRLESELKAMRGDIAQLNGELADEKRLNEVLNSPEAKVATLDVTPQGERALRGRVTYDPVTHRAVVIFENLKPPSGRDYQLWALLGAKPKSLGVIKADSTGRAVVRLDDAGDPATLVAFAVSLEPAGGSPNPEAPSGPVVMFGKIGG